MSKLIITDEQLGQYWDKMDWKVLEDRLAAMQADLTKAVFAGDMERVKQIQRRIVNDRDNKCLAVRHVAASGSGPGVDGIRWKSSAEKMKIALSLTSEGYHATPVRRILVKSKHTNRERNFGIPTYYDRAICVLYGYSLLPVTEAMADRKSFAFRPGRGALDAQAYLKDALSQENAPEIVVCCDVKACFAMIHHDWLLEHVPMDKRMLKEFLEAGYIFAGELFPSGTRGISEASNLSPYLGNFVLDGLQKYIYRELYHTENPRDYADGNMIRFADDIIVMVRSFAEADRVQLIISRFLEERGLRLSEQKTQVRTIDQGFTFLSQFYIRKNGMIFSHPSDHAVERFITEMRETILTSNKSQRDLIVLVNQKLRGWANYHRYSDATEAFRKVDDGVQAALLEAAIKRHPHLARPKLIAKYWYDMGGGEQYYALPEDKSVRVIHLIDTLLVQHNKVKTSLNPFMEPEYLEYRTHEREIRNVNGKYRAIWDRQGGRCYYCGRPILVDQPRELVPIDLKRAPTVRNSAYVHQICSQSEFEIIEADEADVLHPYGIFAALKDSDETSLECQPKKGKRNITADWKYYKLKQFFRQSKSATVILTFKQIEDINGSPLPEQAVKRPNFWYPRSNANTISEAWVQEGYRLDHLDIKRKKLKFKREDAHLSSLVIPAALSGKIPDDAVYELERHMEYVIKKYGL